MAGILTPGYTLLLQVIGTTAAHDGFYSNVSQCYGWTADWLAYHQTHEYHTAFHKVLVVSFHSRTIH